MLLLPNPPPPSPPRTPYTSPNLSSCSRVCFTTISLSRRPGDLAPAQWLPALPSRLPRPKIERGEQYARLCETQDIGERDEWYARCIIMYTRRCAESSRASGPTPPTSCTRPSRLPCSPPHPTRHARASLRVQISAGPLHLPSKPNFPLVCVNAARPPAGCGAHTAQSCSHTPGTPDTPESSSSTLTPPTSSTPP